MKKTKKDLNKNFVHFVDTKNIILMSVILHYNCSAEAWNSILEKTNEHVKACDYSIFNVDIPLPEFTFSQTKNCLEMSSLCFLGCIGLKQAQLCISFVINTLQTDFDVNEVHLLFTNVSEQEIDSFNLCIGSFLPHNVWKCQCIEKCIEHSCVLGLGKGEAPREQLFMGIYTNEFIEAPQNISKLWESIETEQEREWLEQEKIQEKTVEQICEEQLLEQIEHLKKSEEMMKNVKFINLQRKENKIKYFRLKKK